jgi:choline-sulfatase
MPWPRLYSKGTKPEHPVLRALRDCMNYDDFFDEAAVRRAIASYYALVSFLDRNIGEVLTTLERTGLARSTRIIHASDHGDNLGTRGLWGKSVMYEESTAVPLIVSGPDLPRGQVVGAPVSLIDMYRTVADAVGLKLPPEDEDLPSRSIWPAVEDESTFADRAVLSEYHAAAAITGTFMIRWGQWKYIHHVGHCPELYDLERDPGETGNLAAVPDYRDVLVECEGRLRSICDPDAVNRQAFEDQAKKIAEHGGIEAIKNRGDFGYTPAPGQTPGFA